MSTLLSNLNVIRATRLSGFVCNGISGMRTGIAVLTENIATAAWWAWLARHEERRELFWQPLYASAGRPAASEGSEKHLRFSLEMDQTCPSRSRSWGQTPVMQTPVMRFALLAVSTTPRLAKSTSHVFDPAG